MTLQELITKLQNIQREQGDDADCVISMDTNDAYNETYLDDVVLNKYNTPDGDIYKVCLHGELIFEKD
jgi:hypothetical protein